MDARKRDFVGIFRRAKAMKIDAFLTLGTVVCVIVPFSGCATPPKGARVISRASDLKSVETYYASSLAKLRPGMTTEEFRQIFPDAYPSGQNGDLAEYELSKEVKYVSQGDMALQNIIWGVGSPRARTMRQCLWFYFRQGQLLSWGSSRGWPKVLNDTE